MKENLKPQSLLSRKFHNPVLRMTCDVVIPAFITREKPVDKLAGT